MKKRLMGEDFCLETELSPEQVESALRSCQWLAERKKRGRKRTAAVPEESGGLSFAVMAGPVRNSWRPRWTCALTPQGNGCRLEARSRCEPFTRIFMFCWFGMLGLFTVISMALAAAGEGGLFLVGCVIAWVWGLGLSGLCFWLPERKAKRLLWELLAGEVT